MASVLSLSPSRLGVTALNINFARCGYRHNGVFSANHKYLYIKLTSTSTSRRIFSSQRQGEPEEKENATDNSIEERRKRSREITNEMKARIRQGPFYRFGADVDKMGSKVFKTPEKLFDKKRSASIPKLTIETLADTTFELPSKEINKPTLLIVAFNELGFRMAQTWREPIERHFGSGEELHSAFRVLELSVVEGWHFKMFPKLMKTLFKRSVDPSRYGQFASFSGNFEKYKEALGIKNTLVCYVYLIDRKGRIRWRADSEAEMQDALRLVENLKAISLE